MSTLDIGPEMVADPGPLYIVRETRDQSPWTVNSNDLQSVLKCSGFFIFYTNFPDGFSLLKVYLGKGPLTAFIFSSSCFFLFLLLCLFNILWLLKSAPFHSIIPAQIGFITTRHNFGVWCAICKAFMARNEN